MKIDCNLKEDIGFWLGWVGEDDSVKGILGEAAREMTFEEWLKPEEMGRKDKVGQAVGPL